MNTQPLDDNNLGPREHSGFRAYSELAGGPSVPSPVPAGTEAAGVALWQLFNAASEQATNDEQDALDEQYELIRSSLAAVVSSSPATPAKKGKRACVCCLHGWYGHDRGSGPCLHDDCSCEGFTPRAPSPATPEGGDEALKHSGQHEMGHKTTPRIRPSDETLRSALAGLAILVERAYDDSATLGSPDVVEALAWLSAVPSPASPAETREGRLVHYATTWAGLWAPWCDNGRLWEWPLARDSSQVTCPDCIDAAGIEAAASPAVSPPGEAEKP